MNQVDQWSLARLKKYFVLTAIAKGFMLWYAIEKVFYADVGISLQHIVLIGLVAQGSKVILEIPSSVVADRWSRRNLVILSDLALIACTVVIGTGSTLVAFLIGAVLWALSDALKSGIEEAFMYDSLAVRKVKGQFKQVYGQIRSLELYTAAATGLFAGLIATQFGFRFVFVLTIVPLLIRMALFWRMQEPAIHRTVEDDVTWLRHIGDAVVVMRAAGVRWLVLLFVAIHGLQSIWFEYYQLLGIELRMSTTMMGVLFAVLVAGMALGIEIARRLPTSRFTIGCVWGVLLVTHLLGLQITNIWLAMCNITLVYATIQMMQFYLEVAIQHQAPSNKRATILSLASSLAYVWFFALVGLYALVLSWHGAQWAFTIVAIPLAVIAVVDILRRVPWADSKQKEVELVHV